ncbi:hypothetical protein ARMGADRAFT_1087642 [Armillaria gallica]|uniref:Uncharacterized protein n=1 Tax=Armillaria gallica TaxID=47427 RepID=A0A2H3DA95_ARMGA|nr:hypothetical protein ARMGADRAFT_1087642 [Armillaria gallica]
MSLEEISSCDAICLHNNLPKSQKKKPTVKKPVDKDALLQKGWATGKGETFLESFITQYTNLHCISRSKDHEFGDTVANQYMEKFLWTMPGSKEQVEAWIKKMQNGIQNWLEHHTNKVDKAPTQKQCANNPLHLLLGKILWAKDNFDNYRKQFDADFVASGRSKTEQPSVYQAFIKAQFEGEDEEMQAEYEEQAEEEGKELHEARKSQDFEPALLDLVATQGMHIGENKEAVPQRFDLAGKGRYKSFTNAYLSFIDKCYDQEEHVAHSLPKEQLALKYVDWATKALGGKRSKKDQNEDSSRDDKDGEGEGNKEKGLKQHKRGWKRERSRSLEPTKKHPKGNLLGLDESDSDDPAADMSDTTSRVSEKLSEKLAGEENPEEWPSKDRGKTKTKGKKKGKGNAIEEVEMSAAEPETVPVVNGGRTKGG